MTHQRPRSTRANAPQEPPVTLRLTRGLCSALRDDVLTAVQKRGVKVFYVSAWGEGHWHIPGPDWMPYPDDDPWVKKHIVEITVSAKQAAWAERLLCQSGKCELESPPIDRSLNWIAPEGCKISEHGVLGRGDMPTPWSESKGKRQTRAKQQRQTRRTRQARQDDGILDTLARWLR